MYKPINGWSKKKILNVIKKRRYNVPAMDQASSSCKYLTPNGNKCAVGLFIPSGHEGQQLDGPSVDLFYTYPDLLKIMPLNKKGMASLQLVHDDCYDPSKRKQTNNAKQAMIDWVNKNVKDEK